MRSILGILVLAFFAQPPQAAETAWQEVAPGVSLRLVSADKINPDGTFMLGLEIDMPEGTKTYWRVPGETGLPTQLDFAGSTGVLGHRIVWPYPTREFTGTYLDYVYHGSTLLPIEVKTGNVAPNIALSVVMGVCSDICIPVQASFELSAQDTPDRPNGLRIKQALADAPIAWDGHPQAIGEVAFSQEDGALHVPLSDPAIDPDTLIAATEEGDLLFAAPQKSPEPNLVLIPLLGKADETSMEGRSIQLTFMTSMGAYEVTRTIRGSGS